MWLGLVGSVTSDVIGPLGGRIPDATRNLREAGTSIGASVKRSDRALGRTRCKIGLKGAGEDRIANDCDRVHALAAKCAGADRGPACAAVRAEQQARAQTTCASEKTVIAAEPADHSVGRETGTGNERTGVRGIDGEARDRQRRLIISQGCPRYAGVVSNPNAAARCSNVIGVWITVGLVTIDCTAPVTVPFGGLSALPTTSRRGPVEWSGSYPDVKF